METSYLFRRDRPFRYRERVCARRIPPGRPCPKLTFVTRVPCVLCSQLGSARDAWLCDLQRLRSRAIGAAAAAPAIAAVIVAMACIAARVLVCSSLRRQLELSRSLWLSRIAHCVALLSMPHQYFRCTFLVPSVYSTFVMSGDTPEVPKCLRCLLRVHKAPITSIWGQGGLSKGWGPFLWICYGTVPCNSYSWP